LDNEESSGDGGADILIYDHQAPSFTSLFITLSLFSSTRSQIYLLIPLHSIIFSFIWRETSLEGFLTQMISRMKGLSLSGSLSQKLTPHKVSTLHFSPLPSA